MGWDLLRRALRSPVIRDRRFALAALANWSKELLTSDHLDAVARVRDPDPDTRAQARRSSAAETNLDTFECPIVPSPTSGELSRP